MERYATAKTRETNPDPVNIGVFIVDPNDAKSHLERWPPSVKLSTYIHPCQCAVGSPNLFLLDILDRTWPI